MALAELLVERIGGSGNVLLVMRCRARLRFVLRDYAAVDQPALDAMPDVALANVQHGQYQIALRGRMSETYEHLAALLMNHSLGR